VNTAKVEKFGIYDYAEPEHIERRTKALKATLALTIELNGYEPTGDYTIRVMEPLADDDGVVRHEIRVSHLAYKKPEN
jgi:hypothetical protein